MKLLTHPKTLLKLVISINTFFSIIVKYECHVSCYGYKYVIHNKFTVLSYVVILKLNVYVYLPIIIAMVLLILEHFYIAGWETRGTAVREVPKEDTPKPHFRLCFPITMRQDLI